MSRKILALALVLSIAPVAFAADAKPAGPEPKTETEKTFYALGVLMSQSVASFRMTPAELEMMQAGLVDGAAGRTPKVDVAAYRGKLNDLNKERMSAGAGEEKKTGAAYAEKAAQEKGAVKKASGLVYMELAPGKGASPKETDKVKVHYTGKLIDGTVFDSSVQRGQPAEFPLNGVIKCWTEGLQLMKVGGKAKLVCPSDIAYGDNGHPPTIKGGATLVFDVELLDIVK